VVRWDATAVDYYSKDHKAYAGGDLHDTENKFDLFNQLRSLGDFRRILPHHTPSHQNT
jgi:hypothetical protein